MDEDARNPLKNDQRFGMKTKCEDREIKIFCKKGKQAEK